MYPVARFQAIESAEPILVPTQDSLKPSVCCVGYHLLELQPLICFVSTDTQVLIPSHNLVAVLGCVLFYLCSLLLWAGFLPIGTHPKIADCYD